VGLAVDAVEDRAAFSGADMGSEPEGEE
jgi:hypothetical protein